MWFVIGYFILPLLIFILGNIELEMMMDSIGDPFLNLYNDGQIPSIPENLLFTNDDNLGGIDLDLPIPSPIKFEQETLSNMTENPGN